MSQRILVQVQPNAKRNEVIGFQGEVLKVKITAPPIEGKANKALIQFLSEVLGVKKGYIRIDRGSTSRRKMVLIDGVTKSDILRQLDSSE